MSRAFAFGTRKPGSAAEAGGGASSLRLSRLEAIGSAALLNVGVYADCPAPDKSPPNCYKALLVVDPYPGLTSTTRTTMVESWVIGGFIVVLSNQLD